MTSIISPPVYEFAGFRLDTRQRQLFGADGRPIPLTGRVFETLLCLVSNQGVLLDKNTLMNMVWPKVVVDENNLNQTISALRKALGEGPGEHRFIVTVPGRGYQFIPSVQRVPEPLPSTADIVTEKKNDYIPGSDIEPLHKIRNTSLSWLWLSVSAAVMLVGATLYYSLRPSAISSSPPTTTPQEAAGTQPDTMPFTGTVMVNSIAVLPFENFSPDPADAYFAAGIHEEILNQLTKMRQMTVIARATMRQYEGTTKSVSQIAHELNVQTIMEGNIRYANNRVRITAQLIDAATGATLWSETYEREFDDIFAIESDIAMQVAASMKTEFTSEEAAAMKQAPTTSIEAYSLYLAALAEAEWATAENIDLVINKIDRALELDPLFLEGWVLKGSIYNRLLTLDEQRVMEGRVISEQASRRAVEIDPDSLVARDGLGATLTVLGKWHDAVTVYRSIPEQYRDDSYYYAWLLLVTGHPQDSLERFRRGLIKSPLAQVAAAFYVTALNEAGDVMGSTAAYQRGAALFDKWPVGHVQAIITQLGLGNINQVEQIARLGLDTPVETPLLELLASPEQAPAVLPRLRDDPRYAVHRSQFLISIWAAYFGLPELALETLSARIEAVPTSTYLLWSPLFAEVRQHPGFKPLVTKAGLVELWREYGWPEFCEPLGEADFTCH